jgi:hypothetical protein
MRFAYEIQKIIKIQSLGGFFPSLSPHLLPLSPLLPLTLPTSSPHSPHFFPSLSPLLPLTLPTSSPHSPHPPSSHSQFNLVFSFNLEMDETEVLAVWCLARKAKKCNRKLWVHPINQGRGEKVAYTLLYKELMDDSTEFFNYFRMTPSSFEELMHLHNRNEENNEKNCILHFKKYR